MAMMMTGRVLLVCALCVLWCGVGGGGCTEGQLPDVGPPVNPASGAGVTHNPVDHTVPDGAGKHSAEQTQLNNVEGSASREVSLEAPLQPVSTTQQTPSSSEPTDSLTNSQSSGGKRQDVQHEGPPGRPGTSPSQEDNTKVSNGNQQSIDPPSPSGNDDVVSSNSGERTEDTPGSTETFDAAPSEEGQERENVTPFLEQPRETSTAAPAVTTQTSSTTPTDVGESSTVKMSEASPQSTGTANTNDTTTKIGDSDGSTAAFHTTSPLLLLIVVACAAAAAVVAA
ncbi:Mucin-associated surface protein (MASP) [Trypanosoma cruzi]|uniref:Mucin-associated surface protein (MASP), putative n=2 Tax=Trypanosoma cruzi TaxID=5693 RepID=Q4E070_TRYCC|nr:mucin-associated surface protein (MASP), putative [Trypanosoma cruzi]EAN98160.1 mucin-associated surface protein (MASP), putative [Trypanosoma cruzi]PWV09776.1 Mucin-associated surface protein (MASP) [Trypanosoma cruzi]|eukprot:XP_820011.1 mucin-associated surface protein (MASP) [Trypanosoma cruzi strain CL Brener]